MVSPRRWCDVVLTSFACWDKLGSAGLSVFVRCLWHFPFNFAPAISYTVRTVIFYVDKSTSFPTFITYTPMLVTLDTTGIMGYHLFNKTTTYFKRMSFVTSYSFSFMSALKRSNFMHALAWLNWRPHFANSFGQKFWLRILPFDRYIFEEYVFSYKTEMGRWIIRMGPSLHKGLLSIWLPFCTDSITINN